MLYETDPAALALLTEDEWETLLASIRENRAPVPRKIVRIVEPLARSTIIRRLLAEGLSRKDVAAQLNLSISMISLILSGKRS